MQVLITGGKGSFGQLLAPRLIDRGHTVVVSSRTGGPGPSGTTTRVLDLGGSIDTEFFVGIDAVVHAASNAARSRRVDADGTAKLVAAATRAGINHFAYISIVGIDEHPFPYYRAKLAAEGFVATHPGHTILRATQFHQFLDRIFSGGPIVTAFSGIEFQVIDGAVVADRLADLVEGGPEGRVADLGGPEVLLMKDMARSWREASGSRKPLITLPALGRSARAFKRRLHHTSNRAEGTTTWAEWLAGRYAPG